MFNKFWVLKNDDIEKVLDEIPYLGNYLDELSYEIAQIRKSEGRNVNPKYIVVNTDESYADQVITVLKENGHWDE